MKNILSLVFFVAIILSFVSYWLTGHQIEAAIAKGDTYKEGCIKLGSNSLYCDCVGNWMATVEAPYTLVDRATLGWFWSSEEAQGKYEADRKACESIPK